MAIRFFQTIAESTTFVGTHYILGSWYTARELGKRSGIFTASGLAGTMIGGYTTRDSLLLERNEWTRRLAFVAEKEMLWKGRLKIRARLVEPGVSAASEGLGSSPR